MNLFLVTASDQHQLSVFARSYDEAVRIYMVHWITNHQAELPDIEVKRRDPLWSGLDVRLLARALDLGIAGVGRLTDGYGWDILPADHRVEEVAA